MSRIDWTSAEVALLRESYGKMRTDQIRISGRSLSSITQKAFNLGLVSEFYRSAWTPKQEEFLRGHYGKISASEIAHILNRKLNGVYTRAYALKLTTFPKKEHKVIKVSLPDSFVQRYIAGESSTALAIEAGMAWATFTKNLDKLGIKRRSVSDECYRRMPQMHAWVAERSKTGELRKIRSACAQGVSLKEWKGFSSTENQLLMKGPEWAEWRRKVFARDRTQCVLCKKFSHEHPHKIDPHHIKPKAKFPELIFDVDNGVTLCRPCHGRMSRREHQFEIQFIDYVASVNKLRSELGKD